MAQRRTSGGGDFFRRWAGIGLLGLACAAPPARGQANAATPPAFSLGGDVRSLFSVLHDFPNPNLDWEGESGVSSDSILRLIGEGRVQDDWSYEIHGAQRLHGDTFKGKQVVGNLGWGESLQATSRYRLTDEDWNWEISDDVSTDLALDRVNLKAALSMADLTVGRQAVNFNQAYFWNPLDVFAPFGALQFDRDYKAGVDAARVDVPLGRTGGLNLVGAVGRETEADEVSWDGSAVLARAFANGLDWDWALQGGKICGGYMAGAGASGEAGPVAVRGEAAYFASSDPAGFSPVGLTNHVEAVLGAGRRLTDALHVEMEYFFNGAGEAEQLNAALPRVVAGTSRQLGRHFLGTAARYEFHPRLDGSMMWIWSLTDGSSALQPGLAFSATENCDLWLGALVGVGPGLDGTTVESEFGAYPEIVYLELKLYF